MDYLSRIVGDPFENFSGRKLPTSVEVMSVFLYQKKVLKIQHKHSIRLTITKVQEKWTEAGISTCGEIYAQKKLSNLLNEVKKLQRNSKRKKSVAQKKRESNFSQKLKKLFDIAKLNVDKYIDENKKLFLAGQRSNNRLGFIDANISTQPEDQSEIMVVDSAEKQVSLKKSTMEEHIESSPESTENIIIIEESFLVSSNNNYLPQKTLTKPCLKKPFYIRSNNVIIDDLNCKLQKLEKKIEELSLPLVFRRMICLAVKFECVAEVLSIVSLETEFTISYRSANRGKELDTALTQFRVVESDHLTLLNCYKAWEVSSFNKIWCKNVGLDFTIMQKVLNFRQQLEQTLFKQNINISSCGIKWLSLLKCISRTYINKGAKLVSKISGKYASCQTGELRLIHPNSAVNYLGFKPSYIVYHQLVATEKAQFMRGVTIIDPEWCPNPGKMFSKSKIRIKTSNISVT